MRIKLFQFLDLSHPEVEVDATTDGTAQLGSSSIFYFVDSSLLLRDLLHWKKTSFHILSLVNQPTKFYL